MISGTYKDSREIFRCTPALFLVAELAQAYAWTKTRSLWEDTGCAGAVP